jgi:hypothetical protein
MIRVPAGVTEGKRAFRTSERNLSLIGTIALCYAKFLILG